MSQGTYSCCKHQKIIQNRTNSIRAAIIFQYVLITVMTTIHTTLYGSAAGCRSTCNYYILVNLMLNLVPKLESWCLPCVLNENLPCEWQKKSHLKQNQVFFEGSHITAAIHFHGWPQLFLQFCSIICTSFLDTVSHITSVWFDLQKLHFKALYCTFRKFKHRCAQINFKVSWICLLSISIIETGTAWLT